MEKQRKQIEQAEKKRKKKATESQKEELWLFAESEVTRHEEEKRAQEHSRMMSEYQQSVERAWL